MVKTIKPVSRIAKIEAEINKIIGEVFYKKRDFLGLDEGWVPCADIYEGKNVFTVETEVPGVSLDDISILLHSNRIEIRGVKRENLPSEGVRYLRLEREYGTFSRVISLPGAIVPEKAHAILENGILRVMMEKLTRMKEKKVMVKIQKTEASSGRKK